MSRELETIVSEMRAYVDRGQLPTTIVLHWADRIAALTASPQAAPEGGPDRLTLALHAYEVGAIRSTRGRVLNHNKCMARVVEAIAASPQVQGGEDDDEPNPPTCCDIAHARGFEDGIKSEEHRARVYAEMTATPQRAPGVTEGCAIQLSDDDWNPYELLDVVRHSLAASTPAVIVERIAECLRQQKQTQRAALAAPVSAPGVDEVRRVMPKGASLRDYLARLGCGELKPVDQMELANMLDDSIDVAVDHFLAWELPQDFHPDNGISFTAPHPRPPFTWPVGTNLFTAVQAKAMFQHCLASGPSGVDGLIDLGEHGELRNATVRGARVVCARADQVNGCTFFGVTFAQG
jgi:hypothetical protein